VPDRGPDRDSTRFVDPLYLHPFDARVRARGDGDRSSRHAEGLGQQLDELGIGGALDRRRLQAHLQRAVGVDG